jgi:hypothetical protein
MAMGRDAPERDDPAAETLDPVPTEQTFVFQASQVLVGRRSGLDAHDPAQDVLGGPNLLTQEPQHRARLLLAPGSAICRCGQEVHVRAHQIGTSAPSSPSARPALGASIGDGIGPVAARGPM